MPMTGDDATMARMRRRCLLSLAAVVLTAMALRLWVNFSTLLPPGMDAAYYPLQARTLLEEGHLAYSDLPVIFALDAALAKLLMAAGGMPIDAAVLLAARIVDGVCQPLLAVAIFALGWTWARGMPRAQAGSALALGLGAAAMVATVSLPMLRMIGDYEKNSLGLVWLGGCAWALYTALAHGGLRPWFLTGLMLVLAGLTHVAACGAALVLGGAVLAVHLVRERRPSWRRFAAVLGGAVAIAGLAWICVALASPRRGLALLAAPVGLFRRHAGGAPLEPLGLWVCVSVYALLAWGGWTLWRDRGSIGSARFSLVAGAGICAALLACPLLDEEYFKRLVLMSPVPAAMVLAHVLVVRAAAGRPAWPALLVGVLSLLSVAVGLGGSGGLSRGIMPVVITPEGAQELRTLRPELGDQAGTVVLARKGLMWWAGFLLHRPVREDRAPAASLAQYRRILVLEEKGAPRGGTPMEPPRHPPGDGRPRPDGGRAEMDGRPAKTVMRLAGPVLWDGTQYRLYEAQQAPP